LEAVGQADSREDALAYLRHVGMGRQDEALSAAFVDRGPEAVSRLEATTPLRFLSQTGRPDYAAEAPGGKTGGRCMVPDVAAMRSALGMADDSPVLARLRPRPGPLQTGGANFKRLTGGRL
jgi:succinate dehydrogenase/fumarate reductase flavoprotein subunit